MPNIDTPLSSSDTNTQVDDDARNPTQTQDRAVVHCTLVFDGVTFVPDALFDALNAAYGTVAYEKNAVGRGTYIFNIST
jgi:hypothetical protein